jgi:carboxyl-terminal processing protease
MQQQPRLPLWFLVANWALVVAAFFLGVMLGRRGKLQLPEPQATALQLIHAEILQSHVDPHDGHELLDVAIGAMVHGLDNYSMYVPPSRVAAYDEDNSGHYEGVGLLMTQQGDDIVVQYPFPGGPADRAGVLPGDRLVAVDGVLLAAEPPAQRNDAASRLVRGEAGTEVHLRVARDDGIVEMAMQRSDVQTSAVKWAHFADPEAGLGYVHLSDFQPSISDRITAALTELRQQHELNGLVLDLRADGGGSLDECVSLARTFLRRGTIVTVRRRGSEVVEAFEAKPESCEYPDLPLVLLVAQHSASASEVLAGALQDHGRAAIVGARTFGKGFVNTAYTWKGLDFRLRLTTAHYYTPNGRDLDSHLKGPRTPANSTPAVPETGGIVPDVAVEIGANARQRVQAVLKNPEPPAKHLAAFTAVAARYGFDVPAPPSAATDVQLAQALATLRERVVAARERAPEAR